MNATRKAVRNMVLVGIGGAVGGYFLGRTVDRQIAWSGAPDSGARQSTGKDESATGASPIQSAGARHVSF